MESSLRYDFFIAVLCFFSYGNAFPYNCFSCIHVETFGPDPDPSDLAALKVSYILSYVSRGCIFKISILKHILDIIVDLIYSSLFYR